MIWLDVLMVIAVVVLAVCLFVMWVGARDELRGSDKWWR